MSNITVTKKVRRNGSGDNLIDRLEVIARDREHIDDVLKGKLSPAEKKEHIRDLLMPDELERYDAGMRLIKVLGDQRVPNDMIREQIDLTVVENLPDKSAEPIRQWMKDNAKNIRLYGSMVDWLYTKDIPDAPKPGDIDIATSASSEKAANELADIIRKTSSEEVQVWKRKLIEGFIVQINKNGEWIDAADLHSMETYETKMPYGWETKEAIDIDGVPTERLAEQLHRRGVTVLNPGVGLEGRGKIGPEASQTPQRLKDIKKIQAVVKVLIKAARRDGKDEIATMAQRDLKKLVGEPAEGYPQIFKPSISTRPSVAKAQPKKRRRRHGNYINNNGRLVRQQKGSVVPGIPWGI